MSHSPLHSPPGASPDSPATGVGDSQAAYGAGWSALSKSLRRGFSWSGNERNCAYLNAGSEALRFLDVSAVSGLDLNQDGRAAVAVDWDHDGDLDLWLASRSGPRLRLLRNDMPGGGSVGLRPVGNASGRDAVGARVELRLAGEPELSLVRVRRAGEGLFAQAGSWLHFGIGEREVLGCVVEWPGGSREIFDGVAGPGRFVLTEGTGRAEREASAVPGAARTLVPGAPPSAERRGATRVVMRSPRPIPALNVQTADGRAARFLGVDSKRGTGTGRPLLLVLWAEWCAPCVHELEQLQERAAELREAGLDVLALSVDAGEERKAALRRLEAIGWDSSSGFASEDAVAVLDVMLGAVLDSEERLALPTSLLIDPAGRALVLYRGPVEPAQVIVDLARVNLDPPARLAAATPFPGRWAQVPPEFDPAALARRYLRRGLPAPARELELSQVELRDLTRVDFQLTLGRARLAQNDLEGAVAAFHQATLEDPASATARRELGLALHRQGQFEEAAAAYTEALQLDSTDERTRFNLALAQASLGQLEEAQAQLDALRAQGSALAAELDARLATQRED